MKIQELEVGDILLFRKRTLLGKCIAAWQGSQYCHAAMYGGNNEILEMYSLKGGRIAFLDEVSHEPIDVFRAVQPLEQLSLDTRYAAALQMREIVKQWRYSIWAVCAAGVRMCVPRFLRRWLFGNSHEIVDAIHCSGAVSAAYRLVGYDLFSKLTDWQTVPESFAKMAQTPFGSVIFIDRLQFE
jgi:hypothetical protein